MENRTKLALNAFGAGLGISWALLSLHNGDKFSCFLAVCIMMMQVSLGAISYKQVEDKKGSFNLFRDKE